MTRFVKPKALYTHLLYGKTCYMAKLFCLTHVDMEDSRHESPTLKPDEKMPNNLGYGGIELEIFIYEEFYCVNTIQDFCLSV